MDYLAESVVDIIPVVYTDFLDGGFYEGSAEYIIPDASYNINETTYESIVPTETSKESSAFAMSTAFNLQMDSGDGGSDVVLVSSDSVHFFVRRSRLLDASNSNFAFLLGPYLDQTTRQSIQVTEDAQTLNIVLHVIYGVSFHLYCPPLETLLQAIGTLDKYGVALNLRILPGTPLFDDIILKMPYQALEVYIVAAEHDLYELARSASSHLLSTSLLSLPKAAILRLNPDYLTMLYNLHISRTTVLHRIVAQPPDGHEPLFHCGFSECQAMKSAWSISASNFVLKANADVSAALIRNTLEALKFALPCTQCQKCVQQRVDEVLIDWTTTPRTICRDPHDFFANLSPKDSEGNLEYGSDASMSPVSS